MIAWIRTALVAAALCALWAGLVAVGSLHGWWHRPLAEADDAQGFLSAAIELASAHETGNLALVLLERGQPFGESYTSSGEAVDAETVFQVASLSKWISAWGVMTLVEAGKLDLDEPVSTYLSRWTLPESEFDNDGVTVRRLLSHSAGLTDGLGYLGFPPGEALQTLEESLTRAADAQPGAPGVVRVGYAPGTGWQYSGGGYTLLQLLVEEVSGEDFATYMKRHVLEPLGMYHSTFSTDDLHDLEVATFYDDDGTPAIHCRFTALAAASLYTTAGDLVRFLQAHLPEASDQAAAEGRRVLRPETIAGMRVPQVRKLGRAIWGLGTTLYVENGAGDFIIGHDGQNAPAINATARLNPTTGDGIVVLATGKGTLASEIGGEWVYWQSGRAGLVTLASQAGRIVALAVGGWALIIIGCVWYLLSARRRAHSPG